MQNTIIEIRKFKKSVVYVSPRINVARHHRDIDFRLMLVFMIVYIIFTNPLIFYV